jgi:hypothetical protein
MPTFEFPRSRSTDIRNRSVPQSQAPGSSILLNHVHLISPRAQELHLAGRLMLAKISALSFNQPIEY